MTCVSSTNIGFKFFKNGDNKVKAQAAGSKAKQVSFEYHPSTVSSAQTVIEENVQQSNGQAMNLSLFAKDCRSVIGGN